MLTINEYRKVESLEEAYELNQKKNNKIIAGGVWMKIGPENCDGNRSVRAWAGSDHRDGYRVCHRCHDNTA